MGHGPSSMSKSTSETRTTTGKPRFWTLLRKKPAPFPFLDLPRDLRDRVYIELLKVPRVAVSREAHRETHRKVTKDGPFSFSQGGHRRNRRASCIMFAPFPAPESLLLPSRLLLLNRQIHGEVKEILSGRRLEIRPLTYTLDCLFVRAGMLYPTWHSVPVLSSNIDILVAKLRLCGDVTKRFKPGWVVENGGPNRMMWNLLALLNRFLSRGADFLSEPPKTRSTTVGLLVLDVVTPLEGGSSSEAADGRERTRQAIEMIVVWMAKFVGMLLQDECGEILREKVGVIRLCIDGQERRTFDGSHAG